VKQCINEGCVNPVKKISFSKSGYAIKHNFCNTCIQTKSNYGITVPERNALLEEQSGTCALCEKAIEFKGQTKKGDSSEGVAVVDHCHDKQVVRGILCSNCNRGLGLFYENKNTLLRAIKYLENTEND